MRTRVMHYSYRRLPRIFVFKYLNNSFLASFPLRTETSDRERRIPGLARVRKNIPSLFFFFLLSLFRWRDPESRIFRDRIERLPVPQSMGELAPATRGKIFVPQHKMIFIDTLRLTRAQIARERAIKNFALLAIDGL